MAWVTAIGPDAAQIEYRLDANAGCSLSTGDDAQVAYRLDGDRPLEWIGEGLREVGIEPGSVLDEAGKDAARALADGFDPRDRSVLVAPKMAVDPRGKLPAGPLVAAVAAAADAAQTTPAELLGDIRVGARYGRMVRGLARERDAYKVPIGDLGRVAAAAGVHLDELYPADDLATARKYADARVRVGNRGYDLTLDLPKSYSVLTALASPQLARELEDAYLDAVRETVTAMQGWAGYGMRGHHGDGHRGVRVDGTGLLGWMTVHRTARPTPGNAPDPHLHAHITILNMVRGTDGKWSTVGAGGRDIHRHAHAADAYVKARLRQVTQQRWGIEWARDPGSGQWEVAAVPKGLRARFSKRHDQVTAALQAAGIDPEQATTAQAKLAAFDSRQAKHRPGAGGDLRAEWHRQAAEWSREQHPGNTGTDTDTVAGTVARPGPAAIVAAAVPGPGRPAPADPTPEEVAEWVFRPEQGLTAHAKVTTRADLLAAAIDAIPGGVGSLGEAEQLVDQVLALDRAVPLPAAGATHLSNAARYTSADIVAAERAVLAAARSRYGAGFGVIDARTVALAVSQFEAGAGHQLSAEQRAVLYRLTGGGHGVDTVVGVAGSGKTTIMSALRAAYEAAGATVAGAATAAVAAQNLQTEAGIDSRTIASWLRRIRTGTGPAGGLAGVDVLVVDEAAMVDDRHLAALLAAAGETGTKVVAIGDPLQLRAVGVGGTFAAVHHLVGGLELAENRRQRDVDEQAALALWRADERRAALHRWADTGRVHVSDTAEQAHAAILTTWDTERARWPDPHERVAQLLMLAHTNRDVDALNAGARALRQAAGELTGPQRTYRLRDGRQVTLGVGDVVLLRVNDRRTRRGGADVLNGYRGIITALDTTGPDAGRVEVEWRRPGPDGPELVREWVTADYVTRGGVTLGYAITASKAQGLAADRALIYGGGMDAHVLYPAMSRDRWRADLYLARALVEDPADVARHGPPATPAEALERTVAAYAAALERDRPDGLVLTELGEQIDPIHPASSPGDDADAVVTVAVVTVADVDAPAPAPGTGTVAYWDALTATVTGLPDTVLHPEPTALQAAMRQRRANTDPAGYRQAEQARHRDVVDELHRLAAGADPSGRYTRAELTDTAGRMRAAATRRQRDADLQAALRAAAARVQRLPAGARTGYVNWEHRDHGRMPTAKLTAAIAAADREAARLANLAHRQAEAAAAAARAADAGDGPAARALTAQRAQLAAQIAAGEQAAQLRQAAAAARAAEHQAWAEVRRLDAERRRNPIVLRLAGTSRAAIAERQEQLRDQARAAGVEAGRYSGQAWQADHAAGGHGGAQRAAAELAQLHRDWDHHAAAAATTDRRTADQRRAQAEQTRRSGQQWHQRADRLRAEAHLRDRMNPILARAADLARAVDQTRSQLARPDHGERARHPEAAHHAVAYDRPGPGIDRGPTLGR